MKHSLSISGLVLLPFIAALSTATPAAAGVTLNGLTKNGVTLNGISVNGVSVNGVSVNGVSINGVSINGVTLNGAQLNGNFAHPIGNGAKGYAVIGVRLPLDCDPSQRPELTPKCYPTETFSR